MRAPFALVLLSGLVITTANATSFDCKRASSWAEKTICANQQLSDLDDILFINYKKALASTSTPDTVKATQRDWLAHTRGACADVDCLKVAYQTRLTELITTVSTGTISFNILGGYKRYYHGHPDKDSATLTITRLKNGRFHLSGDALWGADNPGGPNIGDFEGDFVLSRNRAKFTAELLPVLLTGS